MIILMLCCYVSKNAEREGGGGGVGRGKFESTYFDFSFCTNNLKVQVFVNIKYVYLLYGLHIVKMICIGSVLV